MEAHAPQPGIPFDRLAGIESRVAALEATVSQINIRLESIERRLSALEAKVDAQFRWMIGLQLATLATIVFHKFLGF